VVTSKAGFGQVARDVEISRASPADVTLELTPADGVGLTVVDGRDGRPLDAIVVVRDAQKRIVANQHSGVGEDGTLNIPLADGTYVLSTSATGYGTATLPVDGAQHRPAGGADAGRHAGARVREEPARPRAPGAAGRRGVRPLLVQRPSRPSS
jgi:hypothetical protein